MTRTLKNAAPRARPCCTPEFDKDIVSEFFVVSGLDWRLRCVFKTNVSFAPVGEVFGSDGFNNICGGELYSYAQSPASRWINKSTTIS